MSWPEIDLTTVTLVQWLAMCAGQTRTGTFTINGVRYTDLNEVVWRRANDDWTTPREGPHGR